MRCLRCGVAAWSPTIEKPPFCYVACTGCGLTRLEPFPTTVEAAAIYGDDYFEAAAGGGYADYVRDERIHRRNARARLRRIGEPWTPGEVIVDVGCAYGYTMSEARSFGWSPIGVEVNAAARAAVEREGMTCVESLADVQVPTGTVGAVTFFQSLEHLTDPAGALSAAAQLLRPGGRLVIETWDRSSAPARILGARWQQATPPSVLWLFDREDLVHLCASSGFSVLTCKTTTKWVSAGLIAGQMRFRGGNGIAVKFASRLADLPIPYALTDLITVVAVRCSFEDDLGNEGGTS